MHYTFSCPAMPSFHMFRIASIVKTCKSGAAFGQRRSLLYAIWITVLGCTPGADEPSTQANSFRPIDSLAELQHEIENVEGKPVLLRVRADWAVTESEMDKTFSSKCMQHLLAGVMLLETDVTDDTEDNRELMARYQVIGPPWILLFGEDGEYIADKAIAGYQTEARIVESLQEGFDLRKDPSKCNAETATPSEA